MSEDKKTKPADVVKRVEELLDDPNCIVRIQREMTSEGTGAQRAFVPGKRVTIIIVGTPK